MQFAGLKRPLKFQLKNGEERSAIEVMNDMHPRAGYTNQEQATGKPAVFPGRKYGGLSV
ncbi:hypothetical protein ACIGAN_31550 [Streptomyces sp. NPDC085931]|uniref:hypothetical protein n=1 Tax=Streptomyces sp. NPDC085931 TaxID=3365740 RepID=UPI0037D8AC43